MKKLLFIPALCLLAVACNSKPSNQMPDANNYSDTPDMSQPNNMQPSNQMPDANNYSDTPDMSQSNPMQSSDWDITNQIKKTLMSDNSLSSNARLISVNTKNGVVTLKGSVQNSDENRKVERIVQNVPGVKNVNNQLKVINPN